MDNRRKIAVLGGGTMGPGIAVTYALGGYETCIYSRSQETLNRAIAVCRNSLDLFRDEGIISDDQAAQALERIQTTTSVAEAVQGAWYVAETIVEKPDAKQELYGQLDALLPDGVIIASNTSYLDIFQLMPRRRLAYTVISHWYAPAHILPLVEVVKGEDTLPSVMDAVMELHRSCGKTPVRMEKYIPGFIVNRLQSAMTREVVHLLENGYCTAEELDLAVKTSLMPRGLLLGLVERFDFNGIDMIANSLSNKKFTPAPEPDHPKMVFDHVQRGELGVKTGKGFFDYSGLAYEDVLRKRDQLLLKSVALADEFMRSPLHNTD